MVWLLITIIITSYFGLVLANMLKLNEAGVLQGRVAITFILPLIHFCIMPLELLYRSIKRNCFFEMARLIPTLFLLYPVALAQYAKQAKPLKNKQKVNVKRDIDIYELVSEDVMPMPC